MQLIVSLAVLSVVVSPANPATTTSTSTSTTSTTTTTTAQPTTSTTTAPSATVDWRIQGAVTPVKDQGTCSSSWAFSAAAALESQYFIATGKLVVLSEQNLLDCANKTYYLNDGCNAGWAGYAFEYVIANNGIDTLASYPYLGNQSTCKFVGANIGATCSNYIHIANHDETALAQAVKTVGPVAVTIDASHPSFQNYKSGIYYEPACNPYMLSHAVLVVGYGTNATLGGDYWIVKNSWGTNWGMNGYILMARNRGNNCGIASDAIYPVVTNSPTTTTTAAPTTSTMNPPPGTVDWRTKGAVTPVKNQGQCAAGWAFAAAAALESQHFLSTGNLVTLSEQNLIDCANSIYGNYGCKSGQVNHALDYVKANQGIDTMASYPYQAVQGSCAYKPANVGSSCRGYLYIQSNSETALAQAVQSYGPLAVSIDASHPSFQTYSSGIYYEPACSSTLLNHAVLLVGYGTNATLGGDYWIVKNSYGTNWGMNGYMYMSRNRNNNCGIATSALFPTI